MLRVKEQGYLGPQTPCTYLPLVHCRVRIWVGRLKKFRSLQGALISQETFVIVATANSRNCARVQTKRAKKNPHDCWHLVREYSKNPSACWRRGENGESHMVLKAGNLHKRLTLCLCTEPTEQYLSMSFAETPQSSDWAAHQTFSNHSAVSV